MNQKSRKRAISYISGILMIHYLFFLGLGRFFLCCLFCIFLETVKEFFLLRQRRDASAHALNPL